jgi:hypothetical protein
LTQFGQRVGKWMKKVARACHNFWVDRPAARSPAELASQRRRFWSSSLASSSDSDELQRPC